MKTKRPQRYLLSEVAAMHCVDTGSVRAACARIGIMMELERGPNGRLCNYIPAIFLPKISADLHARGRGGKEEALTGKGGQE